MLTCHELADAIRVAVHHQHKLPAHPRHRQVAPQDIARGYRRILVLCEVVLERRTHASRTPARTDAARVVVKHPDAAVARVRNKYPLLSPDGLVEIWPAGAGRQGRAPVVEPVGGRARGVPRYRGDEVRKHRRRRAPILEPHFACPANPPAESFLLRGVTLAILIAIFDDAEAQQGSPTTLGRVAKVLEVPVVLLRHPLRLLIPVGVPEHYGNHPLRSGHAMADQVVIFIIPVCCRLEHSLHRTVDVEQTLRSRRLITMICGS